MQLFCDLDGVLADFDAHHESVFGTRSCKVADNVDWKAIRAIPSFYADIPPMIDMPILWAAIKPMKPIILTGVPATVEEAPSNKRTWVEKHLGKNVEVICCRSSEKCHQAKVGDVLIDDWNKYKHLWVERGGRWITHTSAHDTIHQLVELDLL